MEGHTQYEAVLEIDLGGTAPDTQHDQLVVRGVAQLSGLLSVSFVDGFTPSAGDRFEVLTADEGLTRFFDRVDLPLLVPGLAWRFDGSTSQKEAAGPTHAMLCRPTTFPEQPSLPVTSTVMGQSTPQTSPSGETISDSRSISRSPLPTRTAISISTGSTTRPGKQTSVEMRPTDGSSMLFPSQRPARSLRCSPSGCRLPMAAVNRDGKPRVSRVLMAA